MRNLDAILTKAITLNNGIKDFLQVSTYKKCSDLSYLEIDHNDSEQLLLWDELCVIADKLADVEEKIEYLTQPIQEISKLHRNSRGKYETRKGHMYSASSSIEAFVHDDYHENSYWTRTRVEHDGKDYYMVGFRGVSLEGLTVRVREVV